MRKLILIIQFFLIAIISNQLFAQLYSTKIGTNALINENGGGSNTGVGHYTLFNTVTSWTNNAQGAWAMYFNDYGQVNSAFGSSALFYNTSGYENTVLGLRAMFNNPNGYKNTAAGFESMYNNGVYNSLDGSFNTALGAQALYSNYGGNYNVAVGDKAGFSSAYGTYNTFVGIQADANASYYTNATAIGSYATVTASNMVVIGNPTVSLIGGQVNWSILSDKRVKKNIQRSVPGLSFINQLQPVSYNYDITAYRKLLRPKSEAAHSNAQFDNDISLQEAKQKKESKIYTGLIAQDVLNAADKVEYDFSGIDKPENDSSTFGIKYAELVVPLIKATKELSQIQDSLKLELSSLIKEFNELIKNGSYEQRMLSKQDQASQLYPSIPASFKNSSIIKYRIKEGASSAFLHISDMNNKVVRTIKIPITTKPASIKITSSQLNKGRYSYSLVVDGIQISSFYFNII